MMVQLRLPAPAGGLVPALMIVALSACGPGATAPVAGECDLTPEILARTGPGDSPLRVDSLITHIDGRTQGVQVQITRRTFNDLALSVSVNAPGNATQNHGASAFLQWRDYIRVVPEDASRMGEILRLVYQVQAAAVASSTDQTESRATAYVGPATFLFNQERIVHAGIGATRPSTFSTDTIATHTISAGNWEIVEGRLDASALARQGRSATATSSHKFKVLTVVDQNDQHVPYRLCSALGWELQY
jgi:hypothetical protein